MNVDLEKLVKKYGNDYALGQKIREIYWNEKDLQRTRLSQR